MNLSASAGSEPRWPKGKRVHVCRICRVVAPIETVGRCSDCFVPVTATTIYNLQH